MARKIIQITAKSFPHDHQNGWDAYGVVVALCDDGTVWEKGDEDKIWNRLPDIPQD